MSARTLVTTPDPFRKSMRAILRRLTDPRLGIQGFLMLDSGVRLLVWGGSLALTFAACGWLRLWPSDAPGDAGLRQACDWAGALIIAALLYNLAYVLLLMLLRAPIPTPREGRYTMKPGQLPDRQLIWSSLIATLTKAYYEAPFPAFLVYQTASLPIVCWLFERLFGPRNLSSNVTRPLFADPKLIQVGRNVVFGYGAIVSAHQQGRDEIEIARTIIEDDVLIGGNVLIYGGCHIKRGAVILGGAIVRPHTVVGEYEVWGGVPARKIKDLPVESAA